MKKSQLKKIIKEEIKTTLNEGRYEDVEHIFSGEDEGGYVELMDIDDHLEAIHYEWEKWRDGPMTEPEDIGRAKADILSYISSYLRRSLK